MPKIRITQSSPVRVTFSENDFEDDTKARECGTIGHPGGEIDWQATLDACDVIDNGLEVQLRFRK